MAGKKRKSLWRTKKEDLPPLPPKSEWGNKDNFAQYQENGTTARCQTWSRMALRGGKKGAEAQCRGNAKGGSKYCAYHAKRLHGKNQYNTGKPETIMQEVRRYRKYFNDDILKRLLDIEKDPDRLKQSEEIDVLTARLTQLIERLDTKESARAWADAQEGFQMVDYGLKASDPASINQGMQKMRRAFNNADYRSWDEVFKAMSNRKLLVESERRRMVENAEVISMTELFGVINHIQVNLYKLVDNLGNQYNLPPDTVKRQIAGMFRELIAADQMALPEPQQPPRKPWWAMHPESRRDYGCTICQNEEFRARNTINGLFTCPKCGSIYDDRKDKESNGRGEDDNAVEVVQESGGEGSDTTPDKEVRQSGVKRRRRRPTKRTRKRNKKRRSNSVEGRKS